MPIKPKLIFPLLAPLTIVLAVYLLSGCSDIDTDNKPDTKKMSFSEFARKLTENIYDYRPERFKDYFKIVKPKLTPSVINFLRTKGYFPNSQSEYETYQKSRSLVEIKKLERIGEDNKHLALVKVTFIEMREDQKRGTHTFIYHVGFDKR